MSDNEDNLKPYFCRLFHQNHFINYSLTIKPSLSESDSMFSESSKLCIILDVSSLSHTYLLQQINIRNTNEFIGSVLRSAKSFFLRLVCPLCSTWSKMTPQDRFWLQYRYFSTKIINVKHLERLFWLNSLVYMRCIGELIWLFHIFRFKFQSLTIEHHVRSRAT